MTDIKRLKSAMALKGHNQKDMAALLNMADVTFSRKLNNVSEFNAKEIREIAEILELSNSDIMEIFMN